MEITSAIRLENRTGNHNKFYEVKVIRSSVSTDPLDLQYSVVAYWGPIGGSPRSMVKLSNASKWSAGNKATELITSKRKKGYSEVNTKVPTAASDSEEALLWATGVQAPNWLGGGTAAKKKAKPKTPPPPPEPEKPRSALSGILVLGGDD